MSFGARNVRSYPRSASARKQREWDCGPSRLTLEAIEEDGIVCLVESRVEEDEDLVARAGLCDDAGDKGDARNQR